MPYLLSLAAQLSHWSVSKIHVPQDVGQHMADSPYYLKK
jgi:hypothetical protein